MIKTTPMTFTQIEFIGGDDKFIDYNIKDVETGLPVDINGATIEFKLKQYGEFYMNSIITKSGSIIDAPNGVCRVVLASADTEGVSGKFIQQLKVTDFSGKIFRGQGIIVIYPAID